jgi:hypothetical protein
LNWFKLAHCGLGSCEQGNESSGFTNGVELHRRLNMQNRVELRDRPRDLKYATTSFISFVLISMAQETNSGLSQFNVEISISHTHTHTHTE